MTIQILGTIVGVMLILCAILLTIRPWLVAKFNLCRFKLHDWTVVINQDASGYYYGCGHCKKPKHRTGMGI